MTKKQIGICKSLQKYKNLNKVLKRHKIPDYWELQMIVPPEYLEFSDDEMDDKTEIHLKDCATEKVETFDWERRKWGIPLAVSTLALIVSIAALFRQ